jgi:phenylacetate-CoA ligase
MMSAGVGRVTDDIFAADGARCSGQLIGVYLVDDNPHVGQMQIVQRSFTEFTVRITNKPKPTQENFDYINGVMHRLLGAEINITFEVLDAIPREASGKVRFIKSELNHR